jgi:sortase A
MSRRPLLRPATRLLIVLPLIAVVLITGCAGPAVDAAAPAAEPAVPVESEAVAAQDRVAGELVPDRLEIPAIDADMPVVKLGWHTTQTTDDTIFSEWDVAEYAAGWHKNSALPGETGNIVMSGHNNILGSVFRELDQLREGDETIVWQGGERHVYTVDQVMIVPEKFASDEQRRDNAKWIGEFDDERLTLVSCWPRNNNTHRIIVIARPAEGGNTAQSASR